MVWGIKDEYFEKVYPKQNKKRKVVIKMADDPRPAPTPRPHPTPAPRPHITPEHWKQMIDHINASALPPDMKIQVIELLAGLFHMPIPGSGQPDAQPK